MSVRNNVISQPANDKSLRLLSWFFIYLIFISKLSFSWLGIPQRFSYIIFQSGMHPYFHIVLCALLGPLFLLMSRKIWMKNFMGAFHPMYKIFVIGLAVILGIQTILQATYGEQGIMAFVALGFTYLLILLYGIAIPQVIPVKEFLTRTVQICLVIIGISIVFKFVGYGSVYKGNRFIGIFKHIPYMVSAASFGCIFVLNSWKDRIGFWSKAKFWSMLLLFMFAVILTGTRSALFACLMAVLIFFFFLKDTNPRFQMGRMLFFWLLTLSVILFGSFGYQYAADLITGKIALGEREAQNGIEERMEEVQRGLEIVQQSPYLGLGLLSKFGNSGNEDMVDSYNSFQDPHNLFVSAAVVGGVPLAVWITFGVVLLLIGAIKTVFRGETPPLTVGVYLICHLPILLIYHIHLSIGGLADRYYWLTFCYLALRGQGSTRQKSAKTGNNL